MDRTWSKTKHWLIASITASLLMTGAVQTSFADTERELDPYTIQIMEWMEQGIDINHTELIEQVREYIDEHLDGNTFASLHIDRVQSEIGIVVLSFTTLPEQEHLDAITALADNPNLIQFREVAFTEQQLIDKQAEIDQEIFGENIFQEEEFNVYHTGVDVINNKIEIGIDPLNEQLAQIIYDRYGEDIVIVVQGHEAHLLTGGAATNEIESHNSVSTNASTTDATEQSTENFFIKIIRTITSWLQSIF